jgi:hypothetical protein
VARKFDFGVDLNLNRAVNVATGIAASDAATVAQTVATGALVLNVHDYGATGNYRSATTGAMTAGSAVLTDASGTFSAADVGKLITVVGAGSSADLSTTIASVQNATQATLTVSASTTVSGAGYGYGSDDGAALNAAITAAGTLGATVYLPPGGYAVGSAIAPASNVAVVGAGIGASIVYPFGTVAAFQFLASLASPLTSFTLAHLSIDGVRQVGPYNVSIKGVFTQYCSACTFEDLIIRNTVATGMGADFLTNGTVIHAVRVVNCGRLNQGGVSGGGGNGIGVGTGKSTVEAFSISQCYAYGNGRYGIMVESQTGTTSRGARISNCFSQGNYNHGYGDAGTSHAAWFNNVAYANSFDGFSIDNGTVGVTAVPSDNSVYNGCVALSNSRYGFSYQPSAGTNPGGGNIAYVGCRSVSNTSLGFQSNSIASHPVTGISYLACEAVNNGASGIQVSNPMNDLKISGCRLASNGQTSSTSKTGVQLNANVTGLQIDHNRIYDDAGTQKQTYAIVVPSGVTLTTGHVSGNDVRGNLTGTVSQSGTLSGVVLRDNVGYTPAITQPGVPTSTTVYTNNLGVDCEVHITGGTVTVVAVNGITTGATSGTFIVRALSTITITYSVAPTWVWIPQG